MRSYSKTLPLPSLVEFDDKKKAALKGPGHRMRHDVFNLGNVWLLAFQADQNWGKVMNPQRVEIQGGTRPKMSHRAYQRSQRWSLDEIR